MNASEKLVSTNTDETKACTHHFVNETRDLTVSCTWVNENGQEIQYNTLEPGHACPQQTYTTHAWRFRDGDGRVVGQYVGDSQRIAFHSDEKSAWIELTPFEEHEYEPKPEWGSYRCQATSTSGIEVWSFDHCVEREAIDIACSLIDRMLQDAKPSVVRRLVEGRCKLSIIGRNQVTSDIPEHSYLKLQRGGRDLDSTTRGLGGSKELPVTSVGEENLTMVDDRHYPMENILIHEFGHSVMLIGMSEEERRRVHECYDLAQAKKLYSENYMSSNADEYWAEGCQSWFDATIRTDVNDGHNTRSKLKSHDPDLSSILAVTLGDGPWRFPHTAPCPLSHRKQQREEPTSPGPAIEMDRTSMLSGYSHSGWEMKALLPCTSLPLCSSLSSKIAGSRYFRSCFGSLFSSTTVKRM
jgi:hypothetical protein